MTDIRVGYGYDVHALVEGRPCIIGGVKIPHDRGLFGHSDADVLCHAIGDALLGAAALGDIGWHFPDTDEQYRDISSIILLERIVDVVKEAGYTVSNVDATVVRADSEPSFGAHFPHSRLAGPADPAPGGGSPLCCRQRTQVVVVRESP